MQENWNDQQPIYRQLRDRVAALVMSGQIKEGEFVPSVRQVATESQVNHLTVSKAYQELVDEGVLEMKRGRGMCVMTGAQEQLQKLERSRFIQEQLPEFAKKMQQLNITPQELIELIKEIQ
ncbi:GntR family transcriptional regulator [Sessilibacter sp. MAH1]